MPTATADLGSSAPMDAAASTSTRPRRSARWHRSLRSFHRDLVAPVPADSFVAFRVAFGVLIAFSSARFVARGWVDEFYLSPQHHLTYPRFEWVRPLPPLAMYGVMATLTAAGVAIAVGWRYRLAAVIFTIGFAYTELLDAALYLNHYWFVTLVGLLLGVLPAPRREEERTIATYAVWALRCQIAVVYVFAGVAKLNGDWLFDAQPMSLWLAARTDRPLVGSLLDEPVVALAASWAGALFDLTIVGWLTWRRSRPFAYAAVVGFHLATAALFQIGVFPWVMIALTPVFFSYDWPQRLAGRAGRGRPDAAQPGPTPESSPSPPASRARSRSRWRVGALALLGTVNVVLPIRHHVEGGDVRFDDEGYYFSWRVMLVERTAMVEYHVTDPSTGAHRVVRSRDLLTDWQAAQADTRPDLILATAHLIADRDETVLGRRPIVTVDAWVSVNGRPRQRWIDPGIDLATVSRTSGSDATLLPFLPAVLE